MTVTFADFQPGQWEPYNYKNSKCVVDRTTGRIFKDLSDEAIGDLADNLLCCAPCSNTICTTTYTALRIFRVISCFPLCEDSDPEPYTKIGLQISKSISCKNRFQSLGKDILLILGGYPLCIITQAALWRTACHPTQDMRKYINALGELQFDGGHWVTLGDFAAVDRKINLPQKAPLQEEMKG